MATLKINGLSKAFGINTVFENVTFDVKSGERIGLVGANGAGKTTLLKCIMGTEEYDKGQSKQAMEPSSAISARILTMTAIRSAKRWNMHGRMSFTIKIRLLNMQNCWKRKS